MYLISQLHKNNIGVFWIGSYSHFPEMPTDFTVSTVLLYEHEDPEKAFIQIGNPIFSITEDPEVKSVFDFNAIFWLDRYHADGLRVDAVTSMLHLDYSRNDGEWEPNIYGGNVNLEAKQFLQDLMPQFIKNFRMCRPLRKKAPIFKINQTCPRWRNWFWDEMDDGMDAITLDYFKEDPINRKYHHNKITFTRAPTCIMKVHMMPLSHDEVVHGKSSLFTKCRATGQKFANLAMYVYVHQSGN